MAKNRLRNSQQSSRHRVVGGSLSLDDVIGGVSGRFEDLFHCLRFVRQAVRLAILRQMHARNVRQRPYRNFAVPMLADDEGMHTARVHAEVLAEQKTESRRVKDRPRAQYASRRQT